MKIDDQIMAADETIYEEQTDAEAERAEEERTMGDSSGGISTVLANVKRRSS